MSVVGSFVDGFAALVGASNENQYYKQQARRLRMGADQTRLESSINAQSAMQDAARAEASGFVDAAATGGVTGSAIDVLNNFAADSLFNARSIIYRGETEARNQLYEANVAGANAKSAWVKGAFKATSSVLGGMGQYRENRAAGMSKSSAVWG